MNVLPVRLPADLYEKLQALAHLSGKPMAAIMRDSLEKEIERKPAKIKKKLRYVNPLLEMLKEAEKLYQKLGPMKYHYPQYSDDELIYLEPWKWKKGKKQ